MKIQEGFATVERFDGYRVHSSGYVESCWSNNGQKINSWKRLKQDYSRNGYASVRIRTNTMNYERIQVSHLVLEAFVGPRTGALVACHWDGNPKNNHISNLRWDTRKANEEDKKRHGTHQTGSMNPAAKINESDAMQIRRLYATGSTSFRRLGKQFGLSHKTIMDTVKGRIWKHVN